jgi:hypothetical protein
MAGTHDSTPFHCEYPKHCKFAMSFGGGHRVATLRRWMLHTVFNFSSFPNVSSHSSLLHNFLPWLENKAASTISSSLSIANSSYGNSLFASNSIQTGDCILQVPYTVVRILTLILFLSLSFYKFLITLRIIGFAANNSG